MSMPSSNGSRVERERALNALLQARRYRHRFSGVYDQLTDPVRAYAALTVEAVLVGLQEDARTHAETHQLLVSIQKRVLATRASTRANVIHT